MKSTNWPNSIAENSHSVKYLIAHSKHGKHSNQQHLFEAVQRYGQFAKLSVLL